MPKVCQSIYPWGGGHYARMMKLDARLRGLAGDLECHYMSSGHVHEKLLGRFPPGRVHRVEMPVPIDGKEGPSISLSVANLLAPVAGRPPLVSQIAGHLRAEAALFDREKFDLAINDGDMGANVIADRRGIPCLFVTNQFRPRLYRSRSYFYPAALFIAKQIARATRIVVADSPPPHCICEYNLNLTREAAEKTEYVGHFAEPAKPEKTDLGELLSGREFGYWMKTGNRSTAEATGNKYRQAFGHMGGSKRVVSHADPSVPTSVTCADGSRVSVSEALDKKSDWIQIDAGFLSEPEKDAVLEGCSYAVVNGSHTALGEILGVKSRPIIGMPVYDEHANQIRWAQERGMGLMAKDGRGAAEAAAKMLDGRAGFQDALKEFSKGFVAGGAEGAARIAAEALKI